MIIDAKGFPCPVPVIMTKKALDENTDITVLVDNKTAADNVSMFAKSKGCTVKKTDKGDKEFEIHILSNCIKSETAESNGVSCTEMTFTDGLAVFAFQSDIMGRGNDELGRILIKAFIHTITELEQKPDAMVFYNTGVKLAAADSDVAADISLLEKNGVRILVCGTCVNYFELGGKMGAGTISNMYDILNTLNTAGRIVTP